MTSKTNKLTRMLRHGKRMALALLLSSAAFSSANAQIITLQQAQLGNVFQTGQTVQIPLTTAGIDHVSWTVTDFWGNTAATGNPSTSGTVTIQPGTASPGYYQMIMNGKSSGSTVVSSTTSYAIIAAATPADGQPGNGTLQFAVQTHFAGANGVTFTLDVVPMITSAGIGYCRDVQDWSSIEPDGLNIVKYSTPSQGGTFSFDPSPTVENYTLQGGGAGFRGTSEQLGYLCQGLTIDPSTDRQLATKLIGLTTTSGYTSEAGIMIRDTGGTDASGMMVAFGVDSNNHVNLRYRTTSGGTSSLIVSGSTPAPGSSTPVWLKLVKSGSSFTGYYSTTGTSWTASPAVTVVMTSATTKDGMYCTEGTNINTVPLATATFTNYYSFNQTKSLYANVLANNGLGNVGTLFTGGDGNRLYDSGSTPQDAEGWVPFGKYAGATAAALPTQIGAYEIWNEPNGSKYWKPSNASLTTKETDYENMSLQVLNNIHPAYPDVSVVVGASNDVALGWLNSVLNQLYIWNVADLVDGISVHPYEFPTASTMSDALSTAYQMGQRDLGRAVPIYVTEVAGPALKADGMGSGDSYTTPVTRATWLVQAYAAMQSQNVTLASWYTLMDADGEFSGLIEHSDSVMGKYVPRPVYVAYANYIHQMHGATFQQLCPTVDERTLLYQFTGLSGTQVQVVYSTSGTTSLTFNASSPLTVVDMMGVSTSLSPSGGKVVVNNITGYPQFIVGNTTGVAEFRQDQQITDSVRDYFYTLNPNPPTDQNGWSYGYVSMPLGQSYSSGTFVASNWVLDADYDYSWKGGNTAIKRNVQSPNTFHSNPTWVVRRWNSTVNGPVDISGSGDRNSPSGDGTDVYVFKNGTQLWSQTVTGTGSFSFDVQTMLVAGDAVDFVASPGTSGSYANDQINMDAIITSQVEQPGSVTATAVSGTQINLTWAEGSPSTTGIVIQRSTDGINFTTVNTIAAGSTSYSDTGVNPATSYYYRIQAQNGSLASIYSVVQSGTTLTAGPNAPSGAAASATGSTTATVTWTDNSTDETSFNVERSSDNVHFIQTGTTTASGTSYADSGLTASGTYYYRVRAYRGSDNAYSAYSNTASVGILGLPSAPYNMVATPNNGTKITLTWSDDNSSTNETGVAIDHSTDNVTFSQSGTVAQGINTFQDIGLTPGTTYYYRARAWHNTDYSAYSSTVSGTTYIIPNAPSSLAVTGTGALEVDLSWHDNAANEQNYKVEYKVGVSGTYSQIVGNLPPDTNTFRVNSITSSNVNLTPNTQYYFRVRASNAAGNSSYSNEVSVTTSPDLEDVYQDNADVSGVTITGTWNASSTHASGTNSIHDGNVGKGTKTVQFTPTIPTTGTYDVYGIWVSSSNRATNVPIDITSVGGTTTVYADEQNANYSKVWVLLGTFSFNAGTGGNVLFRTTSTDGFVYVDGIRLVRTQ